MRSAPAARIIARIARGWIGLLAGMLLACGGAWVSAAPVVLRTEVSEPDLIVARCVNRARELGFSVAAVDYQAGSLRLLSLRSDAAMLGVRPVPESASWLQVTVEEDRTVTLRAYGDLVDENEARMHPELRSEMDWLAGELEAAISGKARNAGGEAD
jgi:hypothetical protein